MATPLLQTLATGLRIHALTCSNAAILPACASLALQLPVRRHSTQIQQSTAGIVPAEILQELERIDNHLRKASVLDGRERLQLSGLQLPFGLPKHAIEPGLPSLDMHVRPGRGKNYAKWLRKSGRVPAHVYSLPGEQELLLHVAEADALKLIHTYGRNGCQARVLQINVVAPPPAQGQAQAQQQEGQVGGAGSALLGQLRVKATAVRLNAATQRVEDLEFLYCPQDRQVLVDVPVRLVNDDAAPGTKKGGWLHTVKRLVRYKALGNALPPYVEVNVRHLDLNQAVAVRDMPIPPGTKLHEKDYDAPVVRCTTDVGRE